MQLEKGTLSFFVFDFWNFKLVTIDSELQSALKNRTYFIKWATILQKGPLVPIAAKPESAGIKLFLLEDA